MELKDSKTFKNLFAAFAGETQAHAKYKYYASIANKEGYRQIGAIFEETSGNELEHAEIWFKHIMNGIGDTLENLKNAASGEHYEWVEMYAGFAKEAEEEGFADLARQFKLVAEIERTHFDRYNDYIKALEEDRLFKQEKEVVWKCRNCGYYHTGKSAPQVCPVCSHPRDWFYLENGEY